MSSLRITPEYLDIVRLNECIIKKLEGLISLCEKDTSPSAETYELLEAVQSAKKQHEGMKKSLEEV